jgi:hypothetical protein
MKRISKISIIVSTVFLTCVPYAFAETLNASASFIVHERDMTQYIQDMTAKWLTPNQVIADTISIDSPYHASLKQISWQGDASLKWTKNPQNNVWVFDGTANNLTLYANSFDIHDTFQINAGGSKINVRVDASCQKLQMSMQGQWTVHGEVPVSWNNGQLQAPLQNVTLTPSAQVPKITVGSCEGPSGMQDYLNQQVAKVYADQAGMKNSIISELQKLVNQQIGVMVAKMGTPISFDILGAKVSFTPTAGSNLTTGSWILDGPLVVTAPSGAGVKTIVKGYASANLVDARASGFAFANSLWSEILSFADRAKLTSYKMKSSENEKFQGFMQNRFEQFFIWSDLMSFPTSQVFDISIASTAAVHLDGQTNTFPGVSWDVSAPIDVVMSANMDSASIPYMEFWSKTPASATVAAAASDDGSLNVTYSLTSLDLNYGYRREFYKIRKPTAGMGVGFFADQVKQLHF